MNERLHVRMRHCQLGVAPGDPADDAMRTGKRMSIAHALPALPGAGYVSDT
ncbi:MAG: hypothetical protein U5K73_02735 [Halofilum sp. (in: g-proteobacteria)]|nr:hypothetical protein [Halofilum sp. (in: g-proteobacteria)]